VADEDIVDLVRDAIDWEVYVCGPDDEHSYVNGTLYAAENVLRILKENGLLVQTD
jgi:hypothetical protein